MKAYGLHWLGWGLGAFVVLTAGACVFPSHNPLLNLMSFAAVPWLYVSAGLAVVLLALRQRVAAALCAVAALGLMIGLAPVVIPPKAPPRGQASVRVMFANMYYANATPEKLLPFVRRQKPDILVMVESSPQERALFSPTLAKDYAFDYFFGETHIFSRYPFQPAKYMAYGHTLQGVALPDTAIGPLDLQVVHLNRPWPLSHDPTAKSEPMKDVDNIVTYLGTRPAGRMVVMGDFNATANSYLPRDMARRLKLTLAPTPTGTWPAVLPSILGAGIDNVLYGKDLRVGRRNVGPQIGSDHRPVVFDLYLRD